MNNKLCFIPFIVLTTIILITSCSSRHISTNLDKENFSDYFSASKVKIYKQEKEIKTRYKYIGVVEGQDCQIKPHHAVPDEINARTQARHKAFEQQGNGVIFTGCALLTSEQLAQLNNSSDAQQCHAIVICYAKAFVIE
ncbi:MAG: Rcs stress response system protein RcsF [Colwellia sp.]|nr:Rcs stress response system protein RcsF [Colwellia sp.]